MCGVGKTLISLWIAQKLNTNNAFTSNIEEDNIVSIMLLDDVDTIENSGIRKAIKSFQNNMLECSRHYNTHLVITQHHLMNGWQSKTTLNEANIIVLFMNNLCNLARQ